MAFQRVIDALPLVDRMIEAFRASDGLHGHIRAEWHALVDVACGWKRVGTLLFRVTSPIGASVGAIVHTVLHRLLHRW